MASGRRAFVNLGAIALAGWALAGCRPLLTALGFHSGTAGTLSAASAPLPAFEFRGLRPGVTTYAESRRSLALHYCHDESGVEGCDLRDQSVGDVAALAASAVFQKGVLNAIQITYPSGAYSRLRQTVIATYGRPCEAGSEQLTDEAGVKRMSAVTYWCFRGGKLMLVEYKDVDDGRSTGRLVFTLPQA